MDARSGRGRPVGVAAHPAGRPAAFRLGARQGEPFWSEDTVTVVKAAPDRTGGHLAVVEQLLVAGRTRPPRTEPDGDQIVYSLDGIIDVLVGATVYTLERGGMLFVPRGQPVSMRVLSDTARVLVMVAPAGDGVLRCLVAG